MPTPQHYPGLGICSGGWEAAVGTWAQATHVTQDEEDKVLTACRQVQARRVVVDREATTAGELGRVACAGTT